MSTCRVLVHKQHIYIFNRGSNWSLL